MKNVKEILFRNAANKALKLERFSKGTMEYEVAANGFISLFQVIVDADLEDEYYDWKRKKGYMD